MSAPTTTQVSPELMDGSGVAGVDDEVVKKMKSLSKLKQKLKGMRKSSSMDAPVTLASDLK